MTRRDRTRDWDATSVLVLRLPAPPNKANARGQTRYLNLAKKQYFAACDAWAATQPRPPRTPPAACWWEAHLECWALYDWDNLTAICKWPFDWLVSRRYLHDDDPHLFAPLDWQFPIQVVKRVTRRTLTLTLYPTDTIALRGTEDA